MDYMKNPELQAENQFSLCQNSQRIIKFLLSVSLIFVLFSSLPLLLPLLLHSLNAFLMKNLCYPISKNYMFLLCIGLLAFIVKNSGLIHGSSSPTTYQTEEIVKNNVGGTGESESKELEIAESVAGEKDEEIEFQVEEEEKSLITVEQKYEILNSEEKGEGEGKEIVAIGEDLHDVEETEELNKKCEDFIRKMKAAFCSEPGTCNYSHEFHHLIAIMAI